MACLKTVTIILEDRTKITTDINKSLSDKEIRDSYLKQKYFDKGFGYDKNGKERENNFVKIKKVTVSKKLSCY